VTLPEFQYPHQRPAYVESLARRIMNNMNTYTVQCPALGEEEIVTDLDRAMDICFSMSEESNSYACIRDASGDVVGEYGDIMEDIANLVF